MLYPKSYETLACSFLPVLVFTKIIPLAACKPYTAVETASFRKEIDSISLGSKYANVDIGRSTSSTITNGVLLLPYVPIPRRYIVALSAPGLPDCCKLVKPGTRPAKVLVIFIDGAFLMSSELICDTEPTTFRLVCVP